MSAAQDPAIDAPVESAGGSRILDLAGKWIRPLGTIFMVASISSRCLIPSEDASQGSGIPFLPLTFLCGFCLAVEHLVGRRGPRSVAPIVAWSALVAAWFFSAFQADYRHAALIMAWEWLGIALVFLYARHRACDEGPRVIAPLILALVITQAALATYQMAIQFPDLRARYEMGDPGLAESMREIGVDEGGRLAKAFQQRLYSLEPYGATGHPNSLAGMLVIGIPLVALVALSSLGMRGSGMAGTVLSLVVSLWVLAILLATKSRSAWLAAAACFPMALLLWRSPSRNWQKYLGWGLLAVMVLAVIAAVLAFSGLLDVFVITEAPKSLSYRWEWWQGAGRVIEESPWWGVGAGNFRSAYLEYKLPFSSEEIADPHNFVLELWATGGIGVLVLYLTCLYLAGRAIRLPSDEAGSERVAIGERLTKSWWAGCILGASLAIFLGIGIGRFTAYPAQHLAPIFFLLSVIATAALNQLGVRWSTNSVRQAGLLGLIAAHIHWLAAGGVAFPAVMLLTWSLAASCSNEKKSEAAWGFGRNLILTTSLAALALVFAFNWLIPAIQRDQVDVRRRTMEQELAELRQSTSPSAVDPKIWLKMRPLIDDWVGATTQYAKLLPADRAGWEELAVAQTARMRLAAQLRSGDEIDAYETAVRAWREVIAREPRRSESYRQLALLHREAAASGLDPEGISSAIHEYRKAVERYPNLALYRWELADVLSKLSRRREAKKEFQKALDLDKTPHEDKRLSEPQRRIAEQYLKSKD